MNVLERPKMNTKNLVITALFIAITFIGSYIKIFGSIAFDSFPGFLAALLFGPVIGAAIGFLGHLLTALSSGFPLSVPLHIVIAFSMAITMFVFGLVYKALNTKISTTAALTITGIIGVLLNGPFSLALSIGALALIAGMEVALGLLALLPILVIASVINVAISIVLFKSLENVWRKIL